MNQINENSVLHVLMYLFHHHMQDDCELDTSQKDLINTLKQAGFDQDDITHAFNWLEQLSSLQDTQIISGSTNDCGTQKIRVYTAQECEKLNTECRGYLLMLEECTILSPNTREIIISCSMSLPELIDVSLIKWVTLMVLFNQPNTHHGDSALELMKLLVLVDTSHKAH